MFDVPPSNAGPKSSNGKAKEGKLLGHSIESLEKMLSPGKWCDGLKFEITIDNLTFLGHPVYSHDGNWGRRHHDDADGQETHQPAGNRETLAAHVVVTAPDDLGTVAHDFTHIPESLDSQKGMSLAASFESGSTASGAPMEPLTMFQIVFVLSSRKREDIATFHEHVAKKLSLALHHCQRQSNYVAHQSRNLLALRSKAKQAEDGDALETEMVGNSELAWAMKEIYEKLSRGDVASFKLSGIEMSLQVPLADAEAMAKQVDAYCALLLLEDKDIILRDLSHPESSPVRRFVIELTATKNLQKHSRNLGISLCDILQYAKHLVKWRKARPIVPLHTRNTYVVRPDAPIDKISELAPTYARRFAGIPSLSQMLKILSGRPIRYGMLIPSKDHRAPFVDILAFLIQHGFVQQLKTFGWLRASLHAATANGDEPKPKKRPVSGVSLLSPHLRPVVDDDNISVTSEKTNVTTIPANDPKPAIEEPTTPDFVIIKDPLQPGPEEAEALRKVKASITEADFRERLPQLLQYFDGKHALEKIAGREGLKRARVEEWLEALDRRGHLITFRAL